MSDGSIASKFDIPTHRPANLGTSISLNQDTLLDSFRRALSGQSAKRLLDDSGKTIRGVISIAENGTAQIKIGDKGFAFAHVGLLSPKPQKRIEFLERYLNERTIARVYANELRSKVRAKDFTNDAFLSVIGTLQSSPEGFVQTIRGKVAARDLTNSDLLPDDARHWDNLVAPLDGSKTLEEFLQNEGNAERADIIAKSPLRAFYISSLSFCAPALVPVDSFRALPADDVLQAMDRAASFSDHFAVTGAFEICADWVTRDDRFETAGVRLLDQLIGDMELLKKRCTFFASMFVMTIARLAQHQTERDKLPFWRRVAAAAHAGLILRACGSDNEERVFTWAMNHWGKPFMFSILLEETSDPRWRLDWLTGEHLAADVFGRVDQAIQKLPAEKQPAAWLRRVEKAREWIAAKHIDLFCVLPAIGESARRKPPIQSETLGLKAILDAFSANPTTETLLTCTPALYIAGVTAEALAACRTVMSQLQKDSPRRDENNTRYVLQTLSFVVAQTQDEGLAESVAEFCIEKTRDLADGESTIEIVCRLVECACAYQNRQKAMEVLAQRLVSVAFLTPSPMSFDLFDSLGHLQLLDGRLSLLLGRALAAARLGRKAA
jgi:hypothetical protein